MAWIQPKTDWVATDYFNAEDYNRIIGNVTHLKALADDVFYLVDKLSLGEEKAVLEPIYAREMNDIENGIASINSNTFRMEIGETKSYKANGKVPTFEDYNRLESAISALYEMLQVHKANLPRLAFNLGNQKGLRV